LSGSCCLVELIDESSDDVDDEEEDDDEVDDEKFSFVFDKALNNTIVLDQSRSLDPVSALYLVDSSSGSVNLILPESSLCTNLFINRFRVGLLVQTYTKPIHV
jgi:hypothetical protein